MVRVNCVRLPLDRGNFVRLLLVCGKCVRLLLVCGKCVRLLLFCRNCVRLLMVRRNCVGLLLVRENCVRLLMVRRNCVRLLLVCGNCVGLLLVGENCVRIHNWTAQNFAQLLLVLHPRQSAPILDCNNYAKIILVSQKSNFNFSWSEKETSIGLYCMYCAEVLLIRKKTVNSYWTTIMVQCSSWHSIRANPF